ncbi:MAG: peptide chain release factor N(5)-glutamine methyltransferase [Saprospiraceae bacterium]|nr:peptide chain release factor N(5)-glutamine methyltransferase [Saprospiraceae bacterium]
MDSKISLQEAKEYVAFLLEKEYGKAEAGSVAKIAIEEFTGQPVIKPDLFLPLDKLGPFEQLCARLRKQEPVQYILGKADFYGLKFNVNNSVLIPRPETEELVVLIRDTIKKAGLENGTLLDIGTGTGCIPITLQKELPNWEMEAWDVSADALEVAIANNKELGTKVDFKKADILGNTLPEGSWDVIVSNPPYIPYSEKKLMPKRVLKHEPELALFVKDDNPLQFYAAITAFAKERLKEKGWLFFECNEFNAEKVLKLVEDAGFKNGLLHKDMLDKNRMVSAHK